MTTLVAWCRFRQVNQSLPAQFLFVTASETPLLQYKNTYLELECVCLHMFIYLSFFNEEGE